MRFTDKVCAALDFTRDKYPEHFFGLFRSHAEPEGGVGATYPLTCEELERSLRHRTWEPMVVRDGVPHTFRSDEEMLQTVMPGHVGITALWEGDVASSATFTASDPKKTGFFNLVVERRHLLKSMAPVTTMVLRSKMGGRKIVHDFFPGMPIDRTLYTFLAPKNMPLQHGKQLRMSEVVDLHELVKYARVV